MSAVWVHLRVTGQAMSDLMLNNLAALHSSGIRIAAPQSRHPFVLAWELDLPFTHPITQRALELLLKWGLLIGTPERPIAAPSRGAVVHFTRRYSRADRVAARLLHVQGVRYLDSQWRSERGLRLRFAATHLRRTHSDSIFTDVPGMVLSDRARRLLEPEGLVGMTLRPVYAMARRRTTGERVAIPWSQIGEPRWELRSSIKLPPLSPNVALTAQDGTPFVGYERQRLELRDPPFTDVILRYRDRDLSQVEPFDVGMTHEHFGKPPCGERLIVSQRVYQLFQKHNIKARWTPVVIEDA